MSQINHNISAPNDGLGDQLRTAFGHQNEMNTELYATKVEKITGKDLSANDFTNEDKEKLDNLNLIGEANVQPDWDQADTTQADYIKNKPVEMFSSVGSFHYVDLATQSIPLIVSEGVEKKITNDTLDDTTNVLNAPYGVTSMWDTVLNQLDFSQTSIGDLITIIPAIEITTSVANQEFQIYIKLGIESDFPVTKQVYNGSLKVAGSIKVNPTRDFSIDTLDIKDYPGEIFVLSDANCTVKSGELDIKVVRKDINIVADHTHTNLSVLNAITSIVVSSWNSSISWITTNGANLIAHLTNYANPHNVTKAQVGLGNASNTSDANKPVSIATQTALNLKQNTLVSATNIKTINGATILGSGDLVIGAGVTLGETDTTAYRGDRGKTAYDHSQSAHAPSNAQKNSDILKAEIEAKLIGEITTHTHPATGGTGDMVLADVQTVSGEKTFLNLKFGLRNVANTFTSFFTNANTASRTYTLPNKSMTVAGTDDVALKQNLIAGTVNRILKNVGTNLFGDSRLWDTGTFFGIGTINIPTKDITLGNQANREIGIELSNSTTVGRDLIISAGKTINYQLNTEFLPLNQLSRQWWGMIGAPNSDVYACTNSDIYKQTNGVGNFNSIGAPNITYNGITITSSGDIYVCSTYGNIYKQTGGVGSFVAQATNAAWVGITAAPNGDVYASVQSGDIYKQTGGVGSFVGLSQAIRVWSGMASSLNGNIYCSCLNGDIYKQTGGIGDFVGLGQTSRAWRAITVAPNGNVYATGSNLDVYVQLGGVGNFTALGHTAREHRSIAVSINNNVYIAVYSGDIYMQNNDSIGAIDLDGGTLIQKAGTGKGTGKSRLEFITGQKTASGTDMQLETLREYIDENGYHIYISIPIYANDAAADADTNLPQGASYKLTGNRTIFHKP